MERNDLEKAINSQIKDARKNFRLTETNMTFGELASMYKDEEISISEQLISWNNAQKCVFIENLILGLPIKSIFVRRSENLNDDQKLDGNVLRKFWHVFESVNEVSAVFEFMGILKINGEKVSPLKLENLNTLSLLNGLYCKYETNSIPDWVRFDLFRRSVHIKILRENEFMDPKILQNI